MKKLVALFLAVMMMTSLLAVGVASAETPDTSEFVELNLLVPGDPPTDSTFLNRVQDVWNEYLKEKLNCSVTIEFLTWNDWETNYNLKLLSGEDLDLVTGGTWLDLWTNCSAGAYLELNDLLPVYAPYIYGLLDEEGWESLKFDGQIYYIPQLWYAQWVDQGYAYRADWAEEVGITEPITNFQQLSDYLLAVQAAAGTGTIPEGINAFDTHNNRAENWYSYVTDVTDDMYLDIATGFTFILAFDHDTETVYSPVFDDDVMLGFANMMKTWYDAHVYETDILNDSLGLNNDLGDGRTAVQGMHTQSYYKGFSYGFYQKMNDDPETEEIEIEGNSTAKCAYFTPGDWNQNLVTVNPANDCMAISYASKNPERALMFLDLYYSDPYLYRLMQYGLEGVNYTVTEDGYRVSLDESQWPEGEDYTFFTNMWGCRIDAYDYPSIQWDPAVVEINAHKMEIAKVYPLASLAFDSSDVSMQYAAVCEVVDQYMPLITYGIVDDVNKTVEEFRSALQTAGIDDLIESVQEQVDEALGK